MAGWDPKKDPVVGRDPALGVYVTKSGRSLTAKQYADGTKTKPTKPPVSLAPKNPVDQAKATREASGYHLPGVPHRFATRAQMVTFLKHSPKYVEKQKGWLNAHHQQALNAAGYAIKDAKVVKYVKPTPKANPQTNPLPKKLPNGGTGGANGGTGGANGAGGGDSSNKGLLDKVMSLDPNVGSYVNRGMIDSLVNAQYDPQANDLRQQIGKNPADLATHLADIKKWYADVQAGVDRSRTRGADMTKSISDASVGNAKAILGSIGGEAALGAQGVAQSGANAANTIQALGANDQQYLNDVQPLLASEGANASARESARMGDLLQGYKQQLANLLVEKGGARTKGVMDAIGQNNALDQQRFANQTGLVQTAGALALNSAKAQDYLTKQQAAQDKATASGNKTILSAIQKANSQQNQYGDDPTNWYAKYPKGGLAPGELVSQVLNTYRSNSLPLTDPRVRQAAVGLIQSYGYKVDPHWVNGWR